MCVLFVYTLLKVVVNYYDLSVLSMLVMGFQKESLDGCWVGGVSSIQVYFGFLEFFFNFAKPLNTFIYLHLFALITMFFL